MDTVMTVTGPVPADRLGLTLVHEHVFLDLTRDVAGRNSLLNDPELAYRELMRYKEAGGVTLVDQTTGGLRGHDHDLLPVKHALAVRDMARRTGLQIVLGAGWYREPYYERRLWRMRTDEIAEELVRDLTVGIDGTDVQAGLLGEIGAHFTWVSPVEERVFRAVARAHRRTGVTIATHALNAPVGLDQLDILREEGVDPRRVIVGHCQSYPYHAYHAEIARRGAFVSFDRLGVANPYEHERMLDLVLAMLRAGLGRHVLFSQDVCWRSDYVAYGGRGYAFVPTGLREELRVHGVSDEEFRRITVENPRRALTGDV
jgi:predicted metal-dependent phosphotriesterase family hydrolase